MLAQAGGEQDASLGALDMVIWPKRNMQSATLYYTTILYRLFHHARGAYGREHRGDPTRSIRDHRTVYAQVSILNICIANSVAICSRDAHHECQVQDRITAVSPLPMCFEPAVIFMDRRMLYGVKSEFSQALVARMIERVCRTNLDTDRR